MQQMPHCHRSLAMQRCNKGATGTKLRALALACYLYDDEQRSMASGRLAASHRWWPLVTWSARLLAVCEGLVVHVEQAREQRSAQAGDLATSSAHYR